MPVTSSLNSRPEGKSFSVFLNIICRRPFLKVTVIFVSQILQLCYSTTIL